MALEVQTRQQCCQPGKYSDNYGLYSLHKPSIDFLELVIFASKGASNEKVTGMVIFSPLIA